MFEFHITARDGAARRGVIRTGHGEMETPGFFAVATRATLKGLDPHKHVTLELGGNAGVIVHSDADLDHAAERVAVGGYYQAGQSCIAVQRVLVHAEVHDQFVERLVKHVEGLKVGDPMDPTVDVGPLIDPGALDRVT